VVVDVQFFEGVEESSSLSVDGVESVFRVVLIGLKKSFNDLCPLGKAVEQGG
jgi:hypothetical protein